MTKKIQFTNKHGLPDEVVNAIMRDRYTSEDDEPCDYSVSKIVSPVQQTILYRQHPDELIVRDVTHYLPSFYGSIAHQILEEAWHEASGSVVEKRLYLDVKGKRLSGKFDCYLEPELRDYKTTKAYKIAKNDFSDWEAQLNCYAYFCEENGYPVKAIRIYAFILNWSKGELYKENYPKSPFKEIKIPLWSKEKQKDYIEQRVQDLKLAEGMTPAMLAETFPCSKKEMWQDFKDVAIVKKGSERATKCFSNREDAESHFRKVCRDITKGMTYQTHEVVERYEGRTRCYDWCDAAKICIQNRNLMREEGIDPDEYFKETDF
jgi:hypothetical protein